MLNPLEGRTFVHKNSYMEFLCPLCRSKRGISISPHLTIANYVQLAVATLAVGYIFYPLMNAYSFVWCFPIWMGFELFKRWKFRKELDCPYCGFDASWYKKDVKVARKLVHEFWEAKNLEKEIRDNQSDES